MSMIFEVIRIVVFVLSYRGLVIGTVWYMWSNVSILYSHSLIKPKNLLRYLLLCSFHISPSIFILLVFHWIYCNPFSISGLFWCCWIITGIITQRRSDGLRKLTKLITFHHVHSLRRYYLFGRNVKHDKKLFCVFWINQCLVWWFCFRWELLTTTTALHRWIQGSTQIFGMNSKISWNIPLIGLRLSLDAEESNLLAQRKWLQWPKAN